MKRRTFLSTFFFTPLLAPLFSLGSNKKIKPTKVWTVDDIVAGMYVTLSKYVHGGSSVSYGATVTKQVGYILKPLFHRKEQRGQIKEYTLNSICDGWVWDNKNELLSKKDLVNYLNENGYRPTTLEELTAMIKAVNKNIVV